MTNSTGVKTYLLFSNRAGVKITDTGSFLPDTELHRTAVRCTDMSGQSLLSGIVLVAVEELEVL